MLVTCFWTQTMCKVLAEFSDFNGCELSHKKWEEYHCITWWGSSLIPSWLCMLSALWK